MLISKDMRKGSVIRMNGELWVCVQANHHKPGKGHAMVRARLKNLARGASSDFTFATSEKLDDVLIEKRNATFLYATQDDCCFMEEESYEQRMVTKSLLGDSFLFLEDGMACILEFVDDAIINVQLPNAVALAVEFTEPGLAGDTVGGATKPARLVTGYELQVPLFVKSGEKIRVDTRTGQYLERTS